MVPELFEKRVMSEDAHWLDEAVDRGISTRLDELLFKYLFPDISGLDKDIKLLMSDMKNIDTIADVITKMNISGKLCDEDQFVDIYKAKESLDMTDPALFSDILPYVIAFSRSRGELASNFEKYMGNVYEVMKKVMEDTNTEEIMSAFENQTRAVLTARDREAKTRTLLQGITGLSSNEFGYKNKNTTGSNQGIEVAATVQNSDMVGTVADFAAQIVMSVPEIRACYIYDKIKKEADKLEKPEEEGIIASEGDSI
jgi:hypothetical protein